MQTNYYYLKQLSTKLNQILTGKLLTECFSQDKDELILGFGDINNNSTSSFYIKALLSPTFACLSFPNTFHRANQNSVNIFENLIGSKVSYIKQHFNERAFTCFFNNNYLLTFKMFGNKSNILLFKNEAVIDLFHHNFKSDKVFIFNSLDRKLDQSYESFLQNNGEVKILFPTFNQKLFDYLKAEESKLEF